MNVPLSDLSSPADANCPAEFAAIVKPNAPTNKFSSGSVSADTPVVAYNDPFVILSKFSVLMRSFIVLPSKYDTDDRLGFVVYSNF